MTLFIVYSIIYAAIFWFAFPPADRSYAIVGGMFVAAVSYGVSKLFKSRKK
jgi:hypothetical protein